MERLQKVETDKVYPVDIVCATHGKIASLVSPSEVENLSVSHRANNQCFAHLDVKPRTDKPMISIKEN